MAQPAGVEPLLDEAYTSLHGLQLGQAEAALERALATDFDDEEVLYAMKCARWWADAMDREKAYPNAFEAGEFIMARWKAFLSFASRQGFQSVRTLSAFKQFAFGVAFERYGSLATDGDSPDPELVLRLGKTSKGRGNYEAAMRHLENALALRRDDPAILAELADTCALVDDTQRSKVLFREAFFINPQAIDLDLLEADFIAKLADKAVEYGKSGVELVEWIPIYAETLKVFSVRRELKPVEAGKLKQSMYEMERELDSDGSRRTILIPRLINKYMWLVDYYRDHKEDKSKIDELLLKIKLLDPVVYKQYVA